MTFQEKAVAVKDLRHLSRPTCGVFEAVLSDQTGYLAAKAGSQRD
jgi:hypothetical protein